MFLDKERKTDKNQGKTSEIFFAEIKVQFIQKLWSDMHTMKGHPLCSSSLIEKTYCFCSVLEANQKHKLGTVYVSLVMVDHLREY